jgi:hypothetical protein
MSDSWIIFFDLLVAALKVAKEHKLDPNLDEKIKSILSINNNKEDNGVSNKPTLDFPVAQPDIIEECPPDEIRITSKSKTEHSL